MALDVQDLYLIHAMDDRNDIRTRAKTIEDNFGLKTASVDEYRSNHGGFGLLKAAAILAAGVGGGVLLTPGVSGAFGNHCSHGRRDCGISGQPVEHGGAK